MQDRKGKAEQALQAAGWVRAVPSEAGTRYEKWTHPEAADSGRVYVGPRGALRYTNTSMWAWRPAREEDGPEVAAVLRALVREELAE